MTNRLHQAASLGDIAQIRELIVKQNYNPNQFDSEKNIPPLASAAAAGQLEAMKELVCLGANLDYNPQTQPSLWFHALGTDKALSIFEYLVQQGLPYSPNQLHPTHAGKTLLWYAAKKEYWDLIHWTLARSEVDINASPEKGANKGITILVWAAGYQQWDLVGKMLRRYQQANINASPEEGEHKGKTVLWWAAAYQQGDLVKEILSKFPQVNINASPEEGEHKGMTVLLLVVAGGEWKLAEEMLRQYPEANINASAEEGPHEGKTVLWLAAANKQWGLVEEMLKLKSRQANINASPKEGKHKGKTVLWLAATNRQWELVLSTLESRKLSCFAPELLTSAPQLGKASILQLAFQQTDKIVKERLLYNLIIRAFLLTDKPQPLTRETLSECLQQREEELLVSLFDTIQPSAQAKEEAASLMKQPRLSLLQLFTTMEILWSTSPFTLFNIHPMPQEMRLCITYHLIDHPSLLNLETETKARLIDCLIDIYTKNKTHEEEALQEGREFCTKLATLAIHAWRKRQLESINTSQVKECYALLSESLLKVLILGDKFSCFNGEAYASFLHRYRYNPIIASQVQKMIIEEIAKLAPKDFETSTLEDVIKQAIAAHTAKPSKRATSKSVSMMK